MSHLVIASHLITDQGIPSNAFELRDLATTAPRYFTTVTLLDFSSVVISTWESGLPRLIYRGRPLATANALIVRGTGAHFEQAAALTEVVKVNNGNVLDDTTRFEAASNTKVGTTLSRHARGVGARSMIVFSTQGLPSLLVGLRTAAALPVIVKPASGRRGIGVVIARSISDIDRHITEHFKTSTDPLIVQELVDIQREFRALILRGACLGIVEKLREPGAVTGNAAQGATFVESVDRPIVDRVTEFVLQHVTHDALIGVDAALGDDGRLHLIEENYAPQWQEFQRATSINVADQILSGLASRDR